MMGKSFRSLLAITWLALLITVVVTGDWVIDLVYEPVATTSDAATETEEPDNAAEHMLMPSPKGSGPVVATLLAGISTDFEATFMAPSPMESATALRADSYDGCLRRSNIPAFILPLRI